MSMNDYQAISSEVSYDPHTGIFRWLKSGHGRDISRPVGTKSSNGYIVICINYKRYLAHRLAWFLTHKVWPDGQIDHKDGNKHNNRIENLRKASNSENCCNKPAKGYSLHKRDGTYQARVTVKGVTHYLGWFNTEEEARQAYLESLDKFHKDFKNLG